jgi:Domain of unknown function (DUF4276)
VRKRGVTIASWTIGIIAEDCSDVEVVSELIAKITNTPFGTKHFVGHGCGRITAKCRNWAIQLKERGCKLLILLHDLDVQQRSQLLRRLEDALRPSPISEHLIVIPVREIEAWLLADERAIERAFGLESRVSRVKNPELVRDPKRKLEEIIWRNSRKSRHYLNTTDNKKIASECGLDKLKRCESFLPFHDFISRKFAYTP